MHDHEKSDRPVLPVKLPNKPGEPGAEVVEGRGLPEGNTAGETRPGRSAGPGVSSDLDRVRQVARKDRDVRFTALLHHVTVDRLREAYRAISPNAAPGVDGVTWRDYGLDLEANLRDLHARVQRGAYRAMPARRVLIPKADEGTAQGASVSPLLANVYLHYAFDLWADQWRRRHANGDVILSRFADDYVAGFQHRDDAERFLADLRERFAEFGLELHPEKTRLIEFGRYAAERRKARGDRKPETFEFLGFTHICAKDRHGRFKLKRVTSKKKMRAKLK